jgi:hypothetical protein
MVSKTQDGSMEFVQHPDISISRKQRPPLWPSGHSSWLQIQRSRVRFLVTDPGVPGSNLNAIRFSEKLCVWGGVHSAS